MLNGADPFVGPVAGTVAGAPRWLVLGASPRKGVTELPEPVPCGAGWATAELGGVAPTAEGKLEPPRSACGANPVLTVDDFSTVVLSDSDVTWGTAFGVAGVIATGWLAAVLSVGTAAVVAVLTA
jgi:hypothetical protein